MGGQGSRVGSTPDTEHCRKLLAELERAERAYPAARVAVYELAEQALAAGNHERGRATGLPALPHHTAKHRAGRMQMDKPPELRLHEWRDRRQGGGG